MQAESAESACAWKEAFAWESVAASPLAPAPGALCGPSGLRLRALASGLRALPRRLSSPGEESCPEGLPHYACRSPSPLAPAPAARSEWERREERGRAIQGWTSDVVPSGSRPEPSVLGTFVLDSPSKVPFTSFWGPIGASVAESESVRSSLSGAVCPGYICSERSLQNSFHTKWSAVQACPIRLKPSLLCLAHENAKGTEHTYGTLPAPHTLRIR